MHLLHQTKHPSRMKKILLLLSVLLCLPLAAQQHRPKVAVVLSGGGAKGVAHISALKVIEEAGIPVDMVVGTSMGSLIGGLYSIGYRPEQIDSMVRKQDWRFLLSDNIRRNRMSFTGKQRNSRYLFSRSFSSSPKDALSGGLVAGNNLQTLFKTLLKGRSDSLDFNRLPVPFACVATDVASNSEYVFHSGHLYTAMRSSMSIPGVFAPVRLDSMVLVDGGVVNNYPVDVARRMGADYVIGVTLTGPRRTYEQIDNLSSVINQITDIADATKYKENVANTDVLIHVNVKGYSAASFSRAAIDTLIRRGDEAARAQWDNLLALRRKIGIDTTVAIRRPGPFPVEQQADSLLQLRQQPDPLDSNSINLGLRFDSEELAALLIGGNMMLPTRVASQAAFLLRLGQHIRARADFLCHTARFGRLDMAYQLDYDDADVYHKGSKAYNITYWHHLAESGFWGTWHNIRVGFGMRYEHYHFKDFLAKNNYQLPNQVKNEDYMSYFYEMQYDNFNRSTYPSRGSRWSLLASAYNTNFVQYKGHTMPLALQGSFQTAIRLSGNRTVLLPFLDARAVVEHKLPYSLSTFFGGQIAGRYMPQQLPFMGVGNVEIGADYTGIAGFRLRQRLSQNNYVSLVGNFGLLIAKDANGGDNHQWSHLYGAGVTYGYDSIIGPIEGTLCYSNRTKSVGIYINVGYNF
jgi:NTE family protein